MPQFCFFFSDVKQTRPTWVPVLRTRTLFARLHMVLAAAAVVILEVTAAAMAHLRTSLAQDLVLATVAALARSTADLAMEVQAVHFTVAFLLLRRFTALPVTTDHPL